MSSKFIIDCDFNQYCLHIQDIRLYITVVFLSLFGPLFSLYLFHTSYTSHISGTHCFFTIYYIHKFPNPLCILFLFSFFFNWIHSVHLPISSLSLHRRESGQVCSPVPWQGPSSAAVRRRVHWDNASSSPKAPVLLKVP